VIGETETARGATSLANTWQSSAVFRPVTLELPAGTIKRLEMAAAVVSKGVEIPHGLHEGIMQASA
jgi:hypothetical protein